MLTMRTYVIRRQCSVPQVKNPPDEQKEGLVVVPALFLPDPDPYFGLEPDPTRIYYLPNRLLNFAKSRATADLSC
jgi:hypothetical protein